MSDTKSSNPKDVLAASERRCLLHLIPSPGLIATALAMQNGAEKYGPYNWRDEGVGACTYLSAAMRHIRTWLDGEEDASDSRVHHLGHAAACLMILLDAQAVGNLVDDRPAPAPTGLMLDHVKSGYHPATEDEETAGEPDVELTTPDYPFGEAIFEERGAKISGFAEHAAPGVGKPTTVIEAADVYEDPFYTEQAIRVGNEAGQLPGKGLAEELERAREEIIAELSKAGLVDPERYAAPNYKPIKRRRYQEDSHWRYDQGCDCRKCEEHEYLMRSSQKGAGSPNSEPTPNPNGGCC